MYVTLFLLNVLNKVSLQQKNHKKRVFFSDLKVDITPRATEVLVPDALDRRKN